MRHGKHTQTMPLDQPTHHKSNSTSNPSVNMDEKIRGKKSGTIIHEMCPAEPQQQWKEHIELSTEALTFHYPYRRMCTATHARTHTQNYSLL